MPRMTNKNKQKYMKTDFSKLDELDTPFDDSEMDALQQPESANTKRGKYKEKVQKRIVQVGVNTWVEVEKSFTDEQVKKKVMELGTTKRLSYDAHRLVNEINKFL